MEDLLSKIGSALIGALACWLIAKYYNRSRLYCTPSRLYEYSNLVEGSSTVQLIIANRGRKTEEAVEVQLSTEYEYHLLAASQNGIDIPKDKTIRISALLPKSEISLVIVAEGKPRFSVEGIRHIHSKNSRGIIGKSLAEAEASSPGTAPAAIFFILFFGIFGYAFGKVIGEDLWKFIDSKTHPTIVQKFTEGECYTAYSNGFEDSKAKDGILSKEDLELISLNSIAIKSVHIKKDMLLVDTEITNLANYTTDYSLKIISTTADSSLDLSRRGDNFIYDITMTDKDQKRTYTLSTFFPEDHKPKKFWIETRIEIGDYWATVKRPFFFGEDASQSCAAPAL